MTFQLILYDYRGIDDVLLRKRDDKRRFRKKIKYCVPPPIRFFGFGNILTNPINLGFLLLNLFKMTFLLMLYDYKGIDDVLLRKRDDKRRFRKKIKYCVRRLLDFSVLEIF